MLLGGSCLAILCTGAELSIYLIQGKDYLSAIWSCEI